MIRFVYIGGQILTGRREFAWWCTVTDRFLEFSENQVWRDWSDFEFDFKTEEDDDWELARFLVLYPRGGAPAEVLAREPCRHPIDRGSLGPGSRVTVQQACGKCETCKARKDLGLEEE